MGIATIDIEVIGPAALAAALSSPLDVHHGAARMLVNAEPHYESDAVIARCQAFAAGVPAGCEAIIITLLSAAQAGLGDFPHAAANATLWAFTQHAALAWAPRSIRVNAIGLGASLAGPFEPSEQAGRTAGPAPAAPATMADIVRTVRAIASWPSMTGQIIRLGV